MTDQTDEKEHTQTFSGYLAELIRLQAERIGKTPQAYVLSFFETRCNAPFCHANSFEGEKSEHRYFSPPRCNAPRPRGAERGKGRRR